ncbi:hypothetical protein [Sporolactobacillus nakayamae]|uniref:hypothetical protein n=1 Tax=Sporolactobacillus nakayamae TaxID=269670 RepID=UPI0015A5C892|nr:hypothetical protein [Sporolactobacillus nakayamae]
MAKSIMPFTAANWLLLLNAVINFQIGITWSGTMRMFIWDNKYYSDESGKKG